MSDHGLNDDDGSNDAAGRDRRLTADLAALRGALREVRAPDADEPRLIAALRAQRASADTARELAELGAARSPVVAAGAGRAARARAWRLPVALAAAAVLAAVTAALTLGLERGDDAAPPASSAAGDAGAAPPAAPQSASFAGAFQPLAFSPGISASQSYSVVRVRIPLTALAPGQSAPLDAAIEAELLVGEDGLARGIRFNRADTLFVSTASIEMGERK